MAEQDAPYELSVIQFDNFNTKLKKLSLVNNHSKRWTQNHAKVKNSFTNLGVIS